jgi:hypothetical protein
MTVKYVPNPAATKQLSVDPMMMAMLAQAAAQGATNARAIAPVETGAYRDSIHPETEPGRGLVVADIRYASFIEFGTSDTQTYAVLRRATDGELV